MLVDKLLSLSIYKKMPGHYASNPKLEFKRIDQCLDAQG